MKLFKASHLVIYIEIVAFLLIIAISWADELFGLSELILGGPHTHDWHEAAFESAMTISVAIPTLIFTKRVVDRMHELEEFLRVCAWCRKVGNKEDKWYSLEEYFENEFSTKTSHGICPSCAANMENSNHAN